MKHKNSNKLLFSVNGKWGWEQSRLKMARIPAHKSDSGKQMLLGHKWKHLVIRNSIKMLTIYHFFFPRVRFATQEVFFH